MICSSCRLFITDPDATECPQCGRPLTTGHGPRAASYGGYSGGFSDGRYADPAPGRGTAYGPPTRPDASRPGQFTPGYNPYGPPPEQMAPPTWAGPPGAPPIVVPAPPANRKKAIIWAVLGALGVIVLCVAVAGVIGVNLGSQLAANALKRTPTTVPLLSGTVTPFANTPAGEQVIFQDTLMSGATGWANDEPKCFYQDDGYHVADGYLCYAPVEALSDVTISVDAKQISGSIQAPYGIILRETQKGYYYEFDLYSDGQWSFGKVTNNKTYTALIWPQTTTIMKTGLHASNHLMVRARGTHFEFFVNGTKVGEADDSTFASGRSGLVCNLQGEAVFTNFQMTRPAA